MIFPAQFESKIGFLPIRESIANLCEGAVGKAEVGRMCFQKNFSEVKRLLEETAEMLSVVASGADTGLHASIDLSGALADLRADGGYTSSQRLYDIKRILEEVAEVRKFFCSKDEKDISSLPRLSAVAQLLISIPALISEIDRCINKYGEVKDNASENLAEIRRNLRGANAAMSRAMRRVMDEATSAGVVEKDAAPTMRDGRLVVPVEAGKRRLIKGIVHDSSATGKTVFIEPIEVIEAGNRLRELEIAEEHEIVEILKKTAAIVRQYLPDIDTDRKVLGRLDFIRAKALFARDVDGRLPHIERHSGIEWYHAVHPALLMSLRAHGREVVPLNLTLDKKNRILIISGPNAGGKSVCLKTTGVVQYMLQCGLLPTVYENSHVGVFENIFVDIGDEQSIENDLSTYSSHLRNMKYFLQHANRHTLILADEMGSGTEPQIGGALAQSILKQLGSDGCYGIVTTHYQNLKSFAGETEGFVNGAMLYDRQHLEPTFQLQVGQAGSSFALDIARKIGLDSKVLEDAKQLVGSEYVNTDKYLLDIARDRRYWANKRQSIREKEAKLDHLLDSYEDKNQSLSQQRNHLLNEARREAKEILAGANAQIEKAIRDIRQVNAEKEATKEIRRQLEEYKRANNEDLTLAQNSEAELPKSRKTKGKDRRVSVKTNTDAKSVTKVLAIEEGGYVKMKGSGVVGRVIKIEGKKAEVAFGALRTTTSLDSLEGVNPPKESGTSQGYGLSSQTVEDSRSRQLNFKQEIDVRGMRGDEAVQAVMYFLDDAVQFGASRLRILHGTGHGILKTLIRQQLDASPAVARYADEDIRFGGAGITVVELE